MRRRWGISAALGIGLLLTQGAFGAHAVPPNVVIDTPGEGESVKVVPVVSGSASMPNGGTVTGGTVTVTPDNEDHGPALSAPIGAGPQGQPVTFSHPFDFAWNGVYTATAQVTGNDPFPDFSGPEQSPVATRTFKLEKPPIAPRNVETSVDETKRIVSVTWDLNPEPDVVVYCIYQNTKFLDCVDSDERTFAHDLKQQGAGDYKYEVQAFREDANPDDKTFVPGPKTAVTTTVKNSPSVALEGGSPAPPPPRSTSGSTRSPSSAPRPPTSAPGGKVTLNGFGDLLGDRSELPLSPRDRSRGEVDTGFDNELPFGSPRTSIVSGEEAAQELNGTPASSGDNKPQELLFLAAGLLVTVILMHVLWIKSEVDRAPLEAVAPEGDVDALGLERARRTAA
jgi:hypothetical protein